MNVTYQFPADEAYFSNLIDRFYQQAPAYRKPSIQFGTIALIIAAAFAGQVSRLTPGVTAGALIMAALIFFGGVGLTKSAILHRFKRRADFGTETTVTLSNEGISARGEHVEGKWNWAAYRQAVRFPDGILLLRPGVIRWLPDSGLATGTANEATALVAAKFRIREMK